MDTEQITILKVGTDEAVSSIQDLKDNITSLRKELSTLDIGSEEYAQTLAGLRENQAALRDAMRVSADEGKSAAEVMRGVSESAKGLGDSYNALVNRMATLRDQFRSTTDESKRASLGKEINSINSQLKAMDAQMGNYQRNVGNYQSGLVGLTGALSAMGGSAAGAVAPLRNVNNGLTLISKTPVIAVLAAIVGVLSAVVNGLKSSEANITAMKESMSAFQSVGILFKNLMQSVGTAVVWVAEQVNRFVTKIFPKLAKAAEQQQQLNQRENALLQERRKTLMQNADDELEISRLRAEAAKTDQHTAEARVRMLEDAAAREKRISERNFEIAKEEYEIAKARAAQAGNSIEENDKLAASYVKMVNAQKDYFDSTRRINTQLAAARKQALGEQAEDVAGLIELQDEWFSKTDAQIQAAIDAKKAEAAIMKELDAIIMEDTLETQAQVDVVTGGIIDSILEAQRRSEEMAKARRELVKTAVAGTADLLGSLADITEANAEGDERAERQAKNLRIAGAVIDTISGAVGAFMQAAKSYPAPLGAAIGAAQAVAISAAGYAQIAKLRATAVSRDSAPSSAGATFQAPAVQTALPQTTVLRGARDEAALNRIAAPQPVYILDSEIQAKGLANKVRVAEATF